MQSRHGHRVNTGNNGAAAEKVLVKCEFGFRGDPGRVDHQNDRDLFGVEVVGGVTPFATLVSRIQGGGWIHGEIDDIVGSSHQLEKEPGLALRAGGDKIVSGDETNYRNIASGDFGNGADNGIFKLGFLSWIEEGDDCLFVERAD